MKVKIFRFRVNNAASSPRPTIIERTGSRKDWQNWKAKRI